MPPSSTAAPSGRPSNATPAAVIISTVASIDPSASRSGGNQRLSCRPRLIFMPEVKSDSSTMTSVRCSSSLACVISTGAAMASPSGPTARPASRYSMDVLTGMRDSSVPLRAMNNSSTPPTANHNAKLMADALG
jgi:hypothetical protein